MYGEVAGEGADHYMRGRMCSPELSVRRDAERGGRDARAPKIRALPLLRESRGGRNFVPNSLFNNGNLSAWIRL